MPWVNLESGSLPTKSEPSLFMTAEGPRNGNMVNFSSPPPFTSKETEEKSFKEFFT